MNIVEPEIWKPNADKPGYLKFERTLTVKEYTDKIIASMEALTPDAAKVGCVGSFEWFGRCVLFKYENPGGLSLNSPLPRDARIICFVEQGSSEGYIVELALLPKDAAAIALITGKCFDREYAWQALRQLSEIAGIMPEAYKPTQ